MTLGSLQLTRCAARRRAGTLVGAALLALATGCPNGSDPTDGGTDGGTAPAWASAFDAESVGWLLNVWGPAGDDLYAVGGEPASGDGSGQGVIMHYDGSAWSELDLGMDVPLLTWSYGFGPDDIFTVGADGTVLHYDGSTWTEQSTPTDQKLWGVWGAAPDDVWAVGGEGRSAGQATILHYDGTEWTEQTVPDLERPQVWAFFKVWGTASDDVWVVGQGGAVLHWDGGSWNEHLVGTGKDLISVWGTGPEQVMAVGGRGNGVVARWDGSEWTSKSLSPLPGFNGVWMRSETAHVVGADGVVVRVNARTLEHREQFLDTRRALHSVFGDAGGRLTAVGGNLSSPMGPFRGIAFTRSLRSGE